MIEAGIFAAAVYLQPGIMPDLNITPGVADPSVTQATIQLTICKDGYTKKVRHVPLSEKKNVIKLYIAAHPDWPQCKPVGKVACEYDHLISLELGGSNDPKNLWPQMYCPLADGGKTCFGAREKDVVETTFKREICAGTLTLADAQARITKDWLTEYKNIQQAAQAKKLSHPKKVKHGT